MPHRDQKTRGEALIALGPGRRRLGVTVSRKVGNAVVRNRVKRGIREWFRRRRSALIAEVDLVIIARQGAASLDGRGIEMSLDALAQRGRLRAAGGEGIG